MTAEYANWLSTPSLQPTELEFTSAHVGAFNFMVVPTSYLMKFQIFSYTPWTFKMVLPSTYLVPFGVYTLSTLIAENKVSDYKRTYGAQYQAESFEREYKYTYGDR